MNMLQIAIETIFTDTIFDSKDMRYEGNRLLATPLMS